MGKKFIHTYEDIISLENLLAAWEEFVVGKRSRDDVLEFGRDLMANLIGLHIDLVERTYRHLAYEAFKINDPKPRDVHKASVRDRLLHHAIYRKLYPYFDARFIADSYSCRLGKGTHRAMDRFRAFAYKVSRNNMRTAWVLKGDVRKFFASIDHEVMLGILRRSIVDQDVLWLVGRVIDSFSSVRQGVGLPLGNLTSQLLVNIYMNEFDQYVKRELGVKYYARYADDFIIMHHVRHYLELLLPEISDFLEEKLKLRLHSDKVFIKTLASGVDFLGWVHFPDHRVLRTTTERRMMRGVGRSDGRNEILQSYLGLLRHGNARRLSDRIRDT